EDRLSALPAALRQQQVDAVTLPVLMDAPGWPLVRSLVIDLADQAIHKHFTDSRLSRIEEITLLGFAYVGCNIEERFLDALVNSGGFGGFCSLILPSVEGDPQWSQQFWAYPLARRLERIDGACSFGEPLAAPLAVRELALASYRSLPEGLSLAPLLDPA